MTITKAINKLKDLKSMYGEVEIFIQGSADSVQQKVKSINGKQINGLGYVLILGEKELAV